VDGQAYPPRRDLADRLLERRALFERIPRLIPDTLEAQAISGISTSAR
jgi:hypothetical protein